MNYALLVVLLAVIVYVVYILREVKRLYKRISRDDKVIRYAVDMLLLIEFKSCIVSKVDYIELIKFNDILRDINKLNRILTNHHNRTTQ